MSLNGVRRAHFAGMFYPANPVELRDRVEHFIETSGVTPSPETVVEVVCPHAGYEYSGPTAGHSFARVQGKKPKRVILLGGSHHYRIPGASLYTRGAFESPLGTFPIDEDFAASLAEAVRSVSSEPHFEEHSLEVMLPFLAVSVGIVPIVPVLFGGLDPEWHGQVGSMLAGRADKSDLVVTSTDLSHYMHEDEANRIDNYSLNALLSKDETRFAKGVRAGEVQMCGAAAVLAGMAYSKAQGADVWSLLDYRTSAATTGDYSRVVGYAAVSMERAA
jgi:MEMO1 family protein